MMDLWNVNTKKEAQAFIDAIVDPEKVGAVDGSDLCRFRMAIPWADYERIRDMAA